MTKVKFTNFLKGNKIYQINFIRGKKNKKIGLKSTTKPILRHSLVLLSY